MSVKCPYSIVKGTSHRRELSPCATLGTRRCDRSAWGSWKPPSSRNGTDHASDMEVKKPPTLPRNVPTLPKCIGARNSTEKRGAARTEPHSYQVFRQPSNVKPQCACARDGHATKQIDIIHIGSPRKTLMFTWGKNGFQCTYAVHLSFEWLCINFVFFLPPIRPMARRCGCEKR